jgi:hypothetical protein
MIVLNTFLDFLGHSALKNIGLPPGAGSACFQSSQDVCLFVSRVSAFECLFPDESNPYLQKSPGYSRARWYVLGFNKSLSTSFSPCLRPLIGLERWVFEVFTLVASGIWLSHPWVDLLGRGAFHTPPLITKSVVALGNQGMLCWVCMGSQDIVYYL